MNRRPRILAVDDDPMNRIVMTEYLEDAYELKVAASGAECLATIEDFRPDIVLLDIMMPGIDGYETCRRIKSDRRWRHVKVILVSAKAMLDERLEGYDAGADDYVTKPFSGSELRAKLDVYLRLRSVEELDDLKGQFLALLAHETRTPLTAILSPARMLEFELEDSPEHLEMVDLIVRGAKRLESMIERALRLCEFESGQALLVPAPLDLGTVLDGVLERERDRIAENHLVVQRRSASALHVEADPDEVATALHGLVVHAIDVSPAASTIAIEWKTSDEWVELRVRDAGAPIDPDWLPHVFEDFYVPSLANHTGDLELGLALTGRIVRAHGGWVRAEPGDGGGNVFVVRMPRTPTLASDDGRDAPTRSLPREMSTP